MRPWLWDQCGTGQRSVGTVTTLWLQSTSGRPYGHVGGGRSAGRRRCSDRTRTGRAAEERTRLAPLLAPRCLSADREGVGCRPNVLLPCADQACALDPTALRRPGTRPRPRTDSPAGRSAVSTGSYSRAELSSARLYSFAGTQSAPRLGDVSGRTRVEVRRTRSPHRPAAARQPLKRPSVVRHAARTSVRQHDRGLRQRAGWRSDGGARLQLVALDGEAHGTLRRLCGRAQKRLGVGVDRNGRRRAGPGPRRAIRSAGRLLDGGGRRGVRGRRRSGWPRRRLQERPQRGPPKGWGCVRRCQGGERQWSTPTDR